MFKVAATRADLPSEGQFVSLDIDGYDTAERLVSATGRRSQQNAAGRDPPLP